MGIAELYTERLLLKVITPAFVHEMFNTKTKDEIKAFLGCDDSVYDFYLDMHQKGMETHRISLRFFLLISKESGDTIGECGFHTWNATHRRAEVYYHMKKDEFKQQGFMREALPKVLEYGFTEMNLHRIQASIADYNTPSKKLLKRFGFTYEGTLREEYCVDGVNEDSDYYSLLKSEWKPNI